MVLLANLQGKCISRSLSALISVRSVEPIVLKCQNAYTGAHGQVAFVEPCATTAELVTPSLAGVLHAKRVCHRNLIATSFATCVRVRTRA